MKITAPAPPRNLVRILIPILLFLLMPLPALAGVITIGSGTSSWAFPLGTYFHDARTQTIYLASEIGMAGNITALALDVTTIPGQVMNNFTIRIKHTALSSYAAASWEGPASGWTTVYQANAARGATGWRTFTFTTPFSYNGTSNLMVDISFNNSSYTTNGASRYTAMAASRSLYYQTDSGYGDPLTWSGTSSPTPNISTYIPNVQLTILIPDIDGDGMPDSYENTYGCLMPNTVDAAVDYDSDGMTSLQEYQYSPLLDPCDPDTDNDGLNDGPEVNTYLTNPILADTDGDGLSDGDEIITYGTSPLNPDTDGDWLGDGDEVYSFGTNPAKWDSDGDGLGDGDEVFYYGTDPADPDTDGDWLGDGDEVFYYGTDPANPDTDGDGTNDGIDCAKLDNAHWSDCGACVDADGDGYGALCDLGADCDDANPAHWSDCGACVDADLDNYGALCDLGADCDDTNAAINPAAAEITCNAIDDNCNGAADDDPADADGDLVTVCGGDCDDADAAINPSAMEITCNGVDENCNGGADDDVDADCDTFGCLSDCNDADIFINPAAAEITCNGIDENCNGGADDGVDADGDLYGTLCAMGADCDDADPLINPAAAEITCNGVDENCDGGADDGVDADGDLYGALCALGADCDDSDPAINPAAAEILCDTIDQNCNGMADDDPADADGDLVTICGGDCDDADPLINPGAGEIGCDGVDQNCNGPADEGDNDGDGYGALCALPDCDDTDPAINPAAAEITCNGIDENCNGAADEGVDLDGDNYGALCDLGADCDDTNAAINPGAAEITCDGIDQNCNGPADDDKDADGDFWRICGGDCNDANPLINPDAAEITCDGIDQNCNGMVDESVNDDGDLNDLCLVTDIYNPDGVEADCDDTNFDIYIGAPELCDEIDNQCPGDIGYGEIDEGCTPLDSDGDGLSDSLEISIGANPNDPDSDDDGVNDGAEYHTYFTNPLDWDSDGDALPDAYEIGHAGSTPPLNALSPADGNTSAPFDSDHNSNVNEYWNGSDPWVTNPVGAAGCFYWADAGAGDGIVSPTDAIELKKAISGGVGNYSGVIPNNGETHELDMDGYVSPLDLIILQKMIQGSAIGPLGSRPTALVTTYAPGATVNVGFTTHVTVSVRNEAAKGTPGFGVIFEIVPASSTATATLLGGEGAATPGSRYNISGPITPGGLSRIVLRMDSAGTLTLRARVPACGLPGIGRSSPEIVLDPAAVVRGQ